MIGFVPGAGYRLLRRVLQSLAWIVVVSAPLLGGWQRLERAEMAVWEADGFDLPLGLRAQLPGGAAPRVVHSALQLRGGGTAVDALGLAFVDPVAGAAAMPFGNWSPGFLLAWLLPLLLASLVGRAFCGWFCPFGSAARALEGVLRRLPWRPPVYQLPRRRPLRWVLLTAALLSGWRGGRVLIVYLLPHLLLQQSVYGLWLLGGGGTALSVFGGLLLAGLLFGPTTFCATLCPTGAALALVARFRLVRVWIAQPRACGARCGLCTRSCWLGLDPASGDPGPDCDGCARCFPVCPRTDLRLGLTQPAWRKTRVLLLVCSCLTASTVARAAGDMKPRLLLHREQAVAGVSVGISVIDYRGVRLDSDAPHARRDVELSLAIVRGTIGAPDGHGVLPARPVYRGPLVIDVLTREGVQRRLRLEAPNTPTSTHGRAIYRASLEMAIGPGTRFTIRPLPRWLRVPLGFVVPTGGFALGWHAGAHFVAATLAFSGLLALALACTARRELHGPR